MTPSPTTKRPLSCAWRIVCVVLLFYLFAAMFVMIFEDSFIFLPARYPEGDWNPSGLQFTDVTFTASDGTNLHGWYVPHENPRVYILFCHGNAGHLANRAQRLRWLYDELDAEVFIFDYRGYGRSKGRPNEKGVLRDARAACEVFAQQANIATSDIVPMGRSLGGAVAVAMAVTFNTRALILENTFTSMPDVAAEHFPWLPVRWLMRTRLDSLQRLAEYSGHLLQFHGDADEIVPYTLGEKLFGAARGPKRFVTIPGGRHNDPPTQVYSVELENFLDNLSTASP